MRVQFLQLMPHVLFDILKGKKEGGSDGRGSGMILDFRPQILLAGQHQAAVGMVDDHDLAGAEQVVRYQKRTQTILSDDPACVADDVRVPSSKAEGTDGEPGIHAGKDGEFARGARGKMSQLVGAGVNFVGFQNFVDHTHIQVSLAKLRI